MRSIKLGRGPSALGAAGSVFSILFGIIWTILAFAITRNSPFPMVGVAFPLFGVIFVLFGVVQLIYNLKNTVSRKRFSLFDITDAASEIDPLERRFGNPAGNTSKSIEDRLGKLDELKSKGLISAPEYDAKRKQLIDEI